MKKNQNVISIFLFAATLLIFFFLNIKGVAKTICTSEGNFAEKKTNVETYLSNSVSGKDIFTELYGEIHNILLLDIIGPFEFFRDDSKIMQRKEYSYDIKPFAYSIESLSDILKDRHVPLIFVQLPDRGRNFQASDSFDYFGKSQDSLISELKNYGVDVFDVENAISDKEVLENYFFVSDVHLTTSAEYLNARLITNYLAEKYSLRFPQSETIFNAENWDWENHEFWGNLGRSSGKVFSGTDNFVTFLPRFDTKLRLTIPHAAIMKEGTFKEVLTNGFEAQNNPSIYWVTNYGQFPQPSYSYENLLAPHGPKILVIADSIMMRTNTFLSLNTSLLTVLDPRAFKSTDNLAEFLQLYSYDAVIVCGCDYNFFKSSFRSTFSFDKLPTISNCNSGYCGMWLDTCNDQPQSQQGAIDISSIADKNFITLVGWAADFSTNQPLSALYIRIGDLVFQCEYGLARDSVSEYFGVSALQSTGFTITIPVEYLRRASTSEIQFIQIGSDGTYKYAPVQYIIN
ncbi:MAG TPA: hypothetical protein PKA81_08170 [Clostridia bacterium]|nr:hypothetical protein [Clostridia bacterium]